MDSNSNRVANISMTEDNTCSQLARFSEEYINIVSQMIAEKISKNPKQTGESSNLNREGDTLIRKDAALPKWNVQP